jgi:hypothetical protein
MNSMNPLMGIFPMTTPGNILLVGFAIFAFLSDRMWRKLPKNHPAVYQEVSNNPWHLYWTKILGHYCRQWLKCSYQVISIEDLKNEVCKLSYHYF